MHKGLVVPGNTERVSKYFCIYCFQGVGLQRIPLFGKERASPTFKTLWRTPLFCVFTQGVAIGCCFIVSQGVAIGLGYAGPSAC
jgi:hypothetical protein